MPNQYISTPLGRLSVPNQLLPLLHDKEEVIGACFDSHAVSTASRKAATYFVTSKCRVFHHKKIVQPCEITLTTATYGKLRHVLEKTLPRRYKKWQGGNVQCVLNRLKRFKQKKDDFFFLPSHAEKSLALLSQNPHHVPLAPSTSSPTCLMQDRKTCINDDDDEKDEDWDKDDADDRWYDEMIESPKPKKIVETNTDLAVALDEDLALSIKTQLEAQNCESDEMMARLIQKEEENKGVIPSASFPSSSKKEKATDALSPADWEMVKSRLNRFPYDFQCGIKTHLLFDRMLILHLGPPPLFELVVKSDETEIYDHLDLEEKWSFVQVHFGSLLHSFFHEKKSLPPELVILLEDLKTLSQTRDDRSLCDYNELKQESQNQGQSSKPVALWYKIHGRSLVLTRAVRRESKMNALFDTILTLHLDSKLQLVIHDEEAKQYGSVGLRRKWDWVKIHMNILFQRLSQEKRDVPEELVLLLKQLNDQTQALEHAHVRLQWEEIKARFCFPPLPRDFCLEQKMHDLLTKILMIRLDAKKLVYLVDGDEANHMNTMEKWECVKTHLDRLLEQKEVPHKVASVIHELDILTRPNPTKQMEIPSYMSRIREQQDIALAVALSESMMLLEKRQKEEEHKLREAFQSIYNAAAQR